MREQILITVPNFIKIGQTVAKLFSKWRPSAILLVGVLIVINLATTMDVVKCYQQLVDDDSHLAVN